MVVVASNNKPWNIKRLCGVDLLEGFLQEQSTGEIYTHEWWEPDPHLEKFHRVYVKQLENLEPGIIHALHAFIVKIISEG